MSPSLHLSHRLQQLPLFASKRPRRKPCRRCRNLFDKLRTEKILDFLQSTKDCPGCDLLGAVLTPYKDKSTNESEFMCAGIGDELRVYIRLAGGYKFDVVLGVYRFPGMCSVDLVFDAS